MPVNENCNHCDAELFEGQDTVYETEGQVTYCDTDCLVLHIRKHAWEYAELLEEKGLIENCIQK